MKVMRLFVCGALMCCGMLKTQFTEARQYAAQRYYYHQYGNQAANNSYYQVPPQHVAPPAAHVSARDIIRRGASGQPEGYVPRTLDQAIKTPKNAREAELLRRRAEDFLNQRRLRQLENAKRPPADQQHVPVNPLGFRQPQNEALSEQYQLDQPSINPFADPPNANSAQAPPATLDVRQPDVPRHHTPATLPTSATPQPDSTALQLPQLEDLQEPSVQPTPPLTEPQFQPIESRSIKFSRTKPQVVDNEPAPAQPPVGDVPQPSQPTASDINLPPQPQQPQTVVEPLSVAQPPELFSPPPPTVEHQPALPDLAPTIAVPPPSFEPAYQPIPGLPHDGSPTINFAPPTETLSQHHHQANQVYNNIIVPGDQCTQCGGHASEQHSNGCRSCQSGCDHFDCPEYYLSFFGGYTNLRDLDGQSGTSAIVADEGSGFGAALGRRQTRNLRTEFEFSFRQNDLTGFQTGSVFQPTDGELNAFAGMVNAYWEFIDVPSRYFKPYIGAGVGFVGFDVDANIPSGPSLITPGTDGDTSFAYQWIAGVNYKAYRNVDVFAEYRFFGADSFLLDSTATALSDQFDYETENVFFGVRWKF